MGCFWGIPWVVYRDENLKYKGGLNNSTRVKLELLFYFFLV
jgi:hypothetical protein